MAYGLNGFYPAAQMLLCLSTPALSFERGHGPLRVH